MGTDPNQIPGDEAAGDAPPAAPPFVDPADATTAASGTVTVAADLGVAPDPVVDNAQAVTADGAPLDPGTPLVATDTVVPADATTADAAAPADVIAAAQATDAAEAATNAVDPAGAPAGVDTPENPAASETPVDASTVQATDPTTGEPLVNADGAAIIPAGVDVPGDVTVPVIVADVDTSGSAALVLDKQADPDPVDVVPSRAEVSAQSVLDEGTLTPPTPGDAIVPVETLDGHTVDASGTADDHQPGFSSVLAPTSGDDENAASIDQRVDPDDRNKGVSNVAPDGVALVVTALVEAYAELGVHKDIVSAAVDAAYANLQGQRSTAQSAGQPDPFPLFVG